MRATSLVVSAALAVALLPACSTTTSRVTGLAPTAGERPRATERALWLSLDDSLRARLSATDSSAPGEAAPLLRLEIEFQPKVLGYSFAPGQLALRDGRGGEWRPLLAPEGYLPLGRGSHFTVVFDRAVGDGERLELVIAGGAVGQRRLEPVTVALARMESRSHAPSSGVAQAGKVLGKVLEGAVTVLLAAH